MVDLLEMLEGPLLGPDFLTWTQGSRQMPEEYMIWEDAQLLSLSASREYRNFEDLVWPLERTKDKNHLNTLWTQIDNVTATTLCTMRRIDLFLELSREDGA
jgi:hypothetical protein